MFMLCLVVCAIIINVNSKYVRGEDHYTCDNHEDTILVSNCISKSYFFPASRATCDYCNKTYEYKCGTDKEWHPVISLPTCKIGTQNSRKGMTCQGLADYTLICPKSNSNKRYDLGTRTVCICRSNCVEITEECKVSNDGKTAFWGSDLNYNPCTTDPSNTSDGPLQITYANQRYKFTCNEGYTLSGGSNEIICKTGNTSGIKPTCERTNNIMQVSGNKLSNHIIKKNTNSENTYQQIKTMNSDKFENYILYIVIGLLSTTIVLLFIYLIHTRIRRRSIENNITKIQEAEAHYDYPVFNTGNSNEDPNYDYPVFPINQTLNQAQPTYEYVAMNELYASSTT